MAGAAVNQPVDIDKEQRDIDDLIQSLLHYKPAKTSKETPSAPADLKTPKNARKITRGPGRPPRNAGITGVSDSPKSSPAPVSSDTYPDSHLHATYLECLTKISNLNKCLIDKVNNLNQKVLEQSQKIETLEANRENGTQTVPTAAVNIPPPKSEISQSLIENVVNRVGKIEENLNSQVLLCRGPTVTTKISSFTEGAQPNLQRLKAEVCKEILGSKVTEIAVDSVGVSIFGKNKNVLKFECTNSNVRDLLLRQAKVNRPSGIFVAEFLSSDKLQIYNRLFNLKKQFPKWLKAVYTRRGTVFAVLGEDSKICSFNTLNDVHDLQLPTASPATSNADVSPSAPPPSPTPSPTSRVGDGSDGTLE